MSADDLIARLYGRYATEGDGIYLEAAITIASLKEERDDWYMRALKAEAALEIAQERHSVFRQLLVETLDSSPPAEGAQEFVNRLSEAMETAADKFEVDQP